METPGQRLRLFREQIKVRQGRLALEIGVTDATISRWELDETPISIAGAMAIQARYGLRCKWLMTGEGPAWVALFPVDPLEQEDLANDLGNLADKLAAAGNHLRQIAMKLRGGW